MRSPSLGLETTTASLLLGSWDLATMSSADVQLVDPLAPTAGLMMCADDGTFTFQARTSSGTRVSTWGHFRWVEEPGAPMGIVQIEHADPDRLGTTTRLEITHLEPTVLSLRGPSSLHLSFDR